MIEFAGIYFDGTTSVRHPVVVTVVDGTFQVRGRDGSDISCPVADVVVEPQVAAIRGTIRLPGGGLVETTDRDGIGVLLRLQRRGGFFSLVHRWENSLRYVAVALVVTSVVVVVAVRFGIPALAKQVAFAVPLSMEGAMGRQALATLDGLLLKPSLLPASRRTDLQTLFGRVARELPAGSAYRLELRTAPRLGANAFALPSGIIVVTDQLVRLARSDDEIAGVLAHEMAHERNRHALRQLLQNSSVALVIAALTGDLTSISTLGATLPTALIDARFSRAFEVEADDGAVAYLRQAGISPRRYAEFLGRLEAEHAVASGSGTPPPGARYLASHPDTRERILRVLGQSGER